VGAGVQFVGVAVGVRVMVGVAEPVGVGVREATQVDVEVRVAVLVAVKVGLLTTRVWTAPEKLGAVGFVEQETVTKMPAPERTSIQA
jgi:hypothetical protein